MTVSRAFAEWALDLSLADIPEDVIAVAKRHLLDGLGCALGAARLGEVPFAISAARSIREPAEATVIGAGHRLPAPMAALANGALVHALDYDDTHREALVHPTSAVLPSAFAVGEQYGTSGAEILATVIAGYEVLIRLGAATQHGFHARGFHATSVAGVFSSALIASLLSKGDVDVIVDALGIAGSMASGSLEFLNTGSSTKQLHPGLAGMNGVLAARLAAEGGSGPSSIFEGSKGLFKAFADTEIDPSAITEGLGSRWETSRMSVKPYPVCQLSHASLDALASVRDQIDLDLLESILFDVPADSVDIVCEPSEAKQQPRSSYEAKFSLPFCAATLLLEGSVGPDSFTHAGLSSLETQRLASKVEYRTTQTDGPAAEAPGRVEVKVSDGRVIVGEVKASRGGESSPLSDDEVKRKFLTNCGDAFDGNAIAELISRFDQLDDLSELMLLTKQGRD